MSPTARAFLLGIIATVVVTAIGVWIFVNSGYYPIGADVPHTQLTSKVINTLRDSSTKHSASGITVPANLDDPTLIALGAREYGEECSGCHLAPGMASSGLRKGLYPQPPSLVEGGIDDDAEAFWIIKHGIKMSAMPAWGRSHNDHEMWALVAFARTLPKMTPAKYAGLTGVEAERGQR